MTVTALPSALPANSTDRLMAVADIVESAPHLYRQDIWWTEFAPGSELHMFPTRNEPEPAQVYGKALVEPSCGTTGCIAGWAVALSAKPRLTRRWGEAGAEALGLSRCLANYLFSANFRAPKPIVADILRRIARLPEGERTFSNMPLVLNDEQLRLLFGIELLSEDGDDDDDYPDDDDVIEFEPAPVIEDPDDVDDPVDSGNGADNEDVVPHLVPA